MNRFAVAFAFALASFATSSALAVQRTFVSVDGSDLANCTATEPCRSFASAINRTSVGGEVIALQSGGYGAVTVDKAVSIISPPGVYAGISVFGGAGVTVTVGTYDSVTLRGLVINAQGGTTGINFSSGGKLVIEGCTISGNFAKGISVNGPSSAAVMIKDTQIVEAGLGIDVGGPGGELVKLSVIDSVLLHVGNGIHVNAGVEATVENSRLIGLASASGTAVDVNATAGHAPAQMHVTNTLIREFSVGASVTQSTPSATLSIASSELAHNGIAVRASTGAIALNGNRLVHNNQAVSTIAGGVVTSSGKNYTNFNVSAGDAVVGPAGLL